jgi:hypothetical protein
MAPRWRHDQSSDVEQGVDATLRAAAAELLRDEQEALEAEPREEEAVLRELTDFVLNDFVPWTATQASRLSGRGPGGADSEATEREIKASYAGRFRPTVTALARELAARDCLSHHEVAQARDPQTAWEIVSLGPVMLEALAKFRDVIERDSQQDASDPRIRSDVPLIAPPYEDH